MKTSPKVRRLLWRIEREIISVKKHSYSQGFTNELKVHAVHVGEERVEHVFYECP